MEYFLSLNNRLNQKEVVSAFVLTTSFYWIGL